MLGSQIRVMKKQINPAIKAHRLRGAIVLIPLVFAICAIPFALAQQGRFKQKARQFQKAADQSLPLRSPASVLTPDLSAWTIVAPYPAGAVEAPCVGSDGAFAYSAAGYVGGPSSATYK